MDGATKEKIKALRKELKSLQPIKPEYQRKLDQKFRLEFNYNSNHMEGNTLTLGETKLLLIFDQTNGTHPYRDYEEMQGHDVAYKLIQEWAKDKDHQLTEVDIRNLNEIILVKPFWKDAVTPDGQPTRRQIKVGVYKEHPNSVILQNGEIFEYASVPDTPILMGELLDWFKLASDGANYDPIDLAALLHYRFVRIHPFDDGNGRISRLLLNYVLMKDDLPPLIIKSADKPKYLAALNKADADDLGAFVEYVAEQLVWSLEISIRAAKGENIDESNDWEKKFSLYQKQLKANGLDKKDPIKINSGIAKKIYFTEIVPLIEKLETKLKGINSLFFDHRILFIVANKHFVGGSLQELMLQNQPVTLDDFMKMEFDSNRGVSNLDYQVSYIGIKQLRRENINFMPVKLSVQFYDFAYKIVNDGEELLSKFYDELITSEEMEKLVNSVGSRILTQYEQIINDRNIA